MKKIIIAIDGPAASGKSTTAKLVAERLGYLHIDTGAMYRAMALKVLQEKISPKNISAIQQLTRGTTVRLVSDQHSRAIVLLDGKEVSGEIRMPEVTAIVSAVSAIQDVRSLMVKEQREMGKSGGIVLEGRDIGTVVFPDAQLKIFMKADARKRAQRRLKEFAANSISVSLDDLEQEILERDNIDSHREHSPLKKADDAVVVDTTNLSIEEQVDVIVNKAKERMA